ncbi:hypothetical protein Agabi119p4_4941 [Agaricus bisporus var. burnettii]|uniref:Uncharacterized protein n=1 Tax=Agaricus bisporus var. burnettii TaxID=192524 RepID=A0A8H7F496_AGABI|nr:hypothetical protein Agabi119p4_4941 [Agaricus bisporus var. burnettii]
MNPDAKWKAQIFGPDNEEQRATSRGPRSMSPMIYGTRKRGRLPPAPTKPRASRSAPFPLRDATWSSFDQGGPSRMEEDTMRETREEGLPLPRIEDWGTAESDKTLTDIGSQVGEEVEEQREDVERRSSQTPPTKLDKGKAREASPQIEDGLVEDTMFELLGITDPERAAHIRKKAMEITDEAFKAAGMEANQTSKKYIEIFRRNIHRLAEIYGNLKDNKSPRGETPMERLGERYHEKWNNERPATSQGAVEQPATTLLPPIQMGIHQPQPQHPIQIKTEYATSIGTSMDTLGKAYKSLYEPPRENESARQYKTRLEAQERHRSISMTMNKPKLPIDLRRTKSPTRGTLPVVHFGPGQRNEKIEQENNSSTYEYDNHQRLLTSPARLLPIPPMIPKTYNPIKPTSEQSNGGRYSFIAPGPSSQQIPHESTLKNPNLDTIRPHKEKLTFETKPESNRQYSFKNYAPAEEYRTPRTQRGLSLARGMSVPMIGGIAEAIEQHEIQEKG